MRTPEQDLLDTIEEIRAKHFPSLDDELVKKIVSIEKGYTENKSEAHKRISEALDAHLAAKAEA